jgi:hypothetical protein
VANSLQLRASRRVAPGSSISTPGAEMEITAPVTPAASIAARDLETSHIGASERSEGAPIALPPIIRT